MESLLDREKGTWDYEKVRNTFLPYEAKVVLGIPISPSLLDDSRILAWTSNGKFTMKSAYGVALNVLKEKKGTRVGGNYFDASRITNL